MPKVLGMKTCPPTCLKTILLLFPASMIEYAKLQQHLLGLKGVSRRNAVGTRSLSALTGMRILPAIVLNFEKLRAFKQKQLKNKPQQLVGSSSLRLAVLRIQIPKNGLPIKYSYRNIFILKSACLAVYSCGIQNQNLTGREKSSNLWLLISSN